MKRILLTILCCSMQLFSAELQVLGDQFQFTEGPALDSAGNLFFSDVRAARIYVLRPDGAIELFRENSGGANGLYFDAAGNLIACEGLNRRLTSTSPDGDITIIADSYEGKPLNKPNDLWIDPAGGIYFSDPAYGKTEKFQDGEHVYYLRPDRSELIRVIDDLTRPNGLIGTPDGKTLYVADPAEEMIWKYAIQSDGSLRDKTRFAEVLCDGMALDELGNLYTTPESVKVYSPQGDLIEIIETPTRPTNVTFGGPENRTAGN